VSPERAEAANAILAVSVRFDAVFTESSEVFLAVTEKVDSGLYGPGANARANAAAAQPLAATAMNWSLPYGKPLSK
jgi:hypothetical protein